MASIGFTKPIPVLDNPRFFGQAPDVEPPPILRTAAAAPQPKRKGNGKLILFAVIILIVLGLAMFFALRNKTPAITVQTEKVSRHTITETVVANGKIYPVLEVHISPEVSGEIIALPVKEGQFVHKGDLLLKINPDVYIAGLNQAKAGYESSVAAKTTAVANLEKADTDFTRNQELYKRNLEDESDYIGFKVARDVAKANVESAEDQVAVSQAAVDNAQDLLDKTTIVAPMDGTITTLNSQLGERVLGTVQNVGTDIMIISDLSAMEARVDIGEMDIVLLQTGQLAQLEVDSFKDRKFDGIVTAVGNSSEGLDSDSAANSLSSSSGSTGQSATQFQVRIRFKDLAQFRPGMSVTATIETRTRTNALAIPIASVTTRVIKSELKTGTDAAKTNSVPTNSVAAGSSVAGGSGTNSIKTGKKSDEKDKPVDVVFVVQGDHVKTVPVKIGISDDDYWEITDGLKEGEEIVTGGYRAISRDLDDGKKIVKGPPPQLRTLESQRRELDSSPKNIATLPDGRGNRPCLARSLPGYPARRICRHHGPFRLRQIHADESGWLSGHPDRRHLRTQRPARQRDERQPTGGNPQPRDRFYFSNLQPAAALRCVAQCGTAFGLCRGFRR
jgi:HlyD family secretion protein